MQAREGVSPQGPLSAALGSASCNQATHAHAVRDVRTARPPLAAPSCPLPFQRGPASRGGGSAAPPGFRPGRSSSDQPGSAPRSKRARPTHRRSGRLGLGPRAAWRPLPFPRRPAAREGGAGRAPPATPPAHARAPADWPLGPVFLRRSAPPPRFPASSRRAVYSVLPRARSDRAVGPRRPSLCRDRARCTASSRSLQR